MSNIKHNIKKATLRGSSFKSNIDTPSISIISTLYNKYRYQSIVKLGNNYGPYTTAWYTQVLANGGTATTGELAALTVFENAVGADMAEFDRLGIMGLQNEIAARTSFVNPTSTMLTLVNSPTFTAGLGFQGNGTTSYINTNYNLSSSSVKFQQNNASMGIYLNLPTTTGIGIHGAISVTINTMQYFVTPNFTNYLNHASGASSTTSHVSGIGFITSSRSNSTQQTQYINGVAGALSASVSGTIPALNAYIFARNTVGTASLFSNARASVYYYGSGAINQSNFYTAIRNLLINLVAIDLSTTVKDYVGAVIDNGGYVTRAEAVALDTFATSLGSDLAEFDRLWIHGLSNSVAARVSLVNPSSTLISLVNSPTFTASQGFTGNSATMALETNYNLSTQSVKYTRDSSSAFTYTRININASGMAIGAYSAPNISAAFYPRFGGNTIFYNNANAGVDGLAAVSDSLGTISVVRTNATDIFSYKRGVQSGTLSRASVALFSATPYVLGCKGLSNSGNQISASGFGSGVVNQVTLNSALQALGTTLGWAV